jgi:hypothetical protein
MRRRLLPVLALFLVLCAPAWAAEPPAAQAPEVRFLDAEAARQVFAAGPDDPYFGHLMPLEMAAKTGAPLPAGTLEEQRAECRRRFQAAVLEFTPEEQDALRWYVSAMDEALAKDYPLLARLPWSFL